MPRNPDMNIHAAAPDAKYMTVEELEENGEWMDDIIDTYKYPNVTRKTIAKKCKMFACADDGRVLTLPFYSLFEKKYVYLPIDFVDQIYLHKHRNIIENFLNDKKEVQVFEDDRMKNELLSEWRQLIFSFVKGNPINHKLPYEAHLN